MNLLRITSGVCSLLAEPNEVAELIKNFKNQYKDVMMIPGALGDRINAAECDAAIASELLVDRDQELNGMSRGQRVRADLSFALTRMPKLLILDHPTTHMDAYSVLMTIKLLKKFPPEIMIIMSNDVYFMEQLSDVFARASHGKITYHKKLTINAEPTPIKKIRQSDIMIRICNCDIIFGETKLFSALNFTIAKRKSAFIGLGKTTLLRVISGDLQPSFGKCTVLGTIGYYAEHLETSLPDMQMLDYVTGRSGAKPAAAKTLLHLFGVHQGYDVVIKRCTTKQRAAAMLAAVILRAPQILILDDPTTYLDADASHYLSKILLQYAGIVLLATNNVGLLHGFSIYRLTLKGLVVPVTLDGYGV